MNCLRCCWAVPMHDFGRSGAQDGRRYLKSLHIDAFGAFHNREIGPFSPGLNVVYGANESGKTTMRKFIGGVLFGWDDARGERNAYRPAGGMRSGSLSFALVEDESDMLACSRARNAQGLLPAGSECILGGVDGESYNRVFSLDGQSLGAVRDVDRMVDSLLTAASGGAQSPASVASRLDARLKACFSKAASNPDSIANLQRELSQVKAQSAALCEEERNLRAHAAELERIRGSVPGLRQAIERSNDRISELSSTQRIPSKRDDGTAGAGDGAAKGPLSGCLGALGLPAFAGAACILAVCGLLCAVLAVSMSRLWPMYACCALLFAAACCGVVYAVGRRGLSHGASRHSAGFGAKRGSGCGARRSGVSKGPTDACASPQAGAACGDLSRVDALLGRERETRDALQERLIAESERAGELRRILEEARSSSAIQDLRDRQAALEGRLDRAMREYAMLLVARQAMSDAIRIWEERSQPAVYRRAGGLMSLMSAGAWCAVVPDGSGGVLLCDRTGMRRKPAELSLGTCQQLHLALRIALLEVSSGVGESLPVIADEVLAHFDDDRREQAALALADLARHRQVLVLTCHSEIVGTLRRASPDVNVVRL
ncbi:MAG: ATP-binding protein [Eggerthellaceae bacterium]